MPSGTQTRPPVAPMPRPGPSAEPVQRRRRNGRRTDRAAFLYILPALIIVVGVIYVGVGYNAFVSTLEWNGISPTFTQVGLGNYRALLEDEIFWDSLRHVGIFAVLTILVQMVIGLTMAILLSGEVVGRNVYKIVMFLPVVLAPAAVAVAFRELLSSDGQVNGALRLLGLDALAQPWLADPTYALYAIIAVNIWSWTGFSFLLYQAALSQIDNDLFEAAQLDGAGTMRTIFSIVIPSLRGTHATLAIIGLIGSLKTFDIVYLTTGGGPGRSTEFLTTYIYQQAINQFNAGYSAALAMVLLLLAVALTTVQMRLYRFGRD